MRPVDEIKLSQWRLQLDALCGRTPRAARLLTGIEKAALEPADIEDEIRDYFKEVR